MLKKLLKYDLQTVFSTLTPLYLAGIVLAITNGVLIRIGTVLNFNFSTAFIGSLFFEVYKAFGGVSFFLIAIIFPASIVIFALYLYKNVFGSEGYLTHTLPVTATQILLSKTLTGALTTIVTGFVVALIALLFAVIVFTDEISVVLRVISFLDDLLFHWQGVPQIVFLMVLCSLLGAIMLPTHLALSFALGHLTKYKVIFSIVAYFVIQNFVIQPLNFLAVFLWSSDYRDALDIFDFDAYTAFSELGYLGCALYAICSLIFFLITTRIINRKLNLV